MEESMNILTKRTTFALITICAITICTLLYFSQKKVREGSVRKDFVTELAKESEELRVPLTPHQEIPEPTEEGGQSTLSTREQFEILEQFLTGKGISPDIILDDSIKDFEMVVHCNDTIARMEQLADLYEGAGRIRDARNWRVVLAYFYEQGWDYCERDRNYSKINSLAQARKYYEAAGWTYAARRVNDKIEEIAKKYEQ